jgi:Mg-chelatase subunit ChlD
MTGNAIEQRPWFKSTQAMLAMATAVIAVVSGIVALMRAFPSRQNVYENIEIVVDASEGMREPFHGKTKQDAIRAAFEEVLSKQTADRDNLALRVYGGDCTGENNTRLVVNFRRNNQDKIRNALRDLKLQGRAPLASAVVKATGDFSRASDVDKRIIVIAGDGGCEPNADKYIRDRLANAADKKIKLDFHFIYLGESAEQFKKLQEVAQATGGMALPADTPERLRAALMRTIEVEPVLTDIRNSTEMLNAVVNRTNASLESLNGKNYSAAEENLKTAQQEFERTELLFQDFRKRQSRDLFKAAQQVASKNRDLQSRVLALVREMIGQAKRGDNDSYNKSIDNFNAAKDTYNSNVRKLDELQRKIAHE